MGARVVTPVVETRGGGTDPLDSCRRGPITLGLQRSTVNTDSAHPKRTTHRADKEKRVSGRRAPQDLAPDVLRWTRERVGLPLEGLAARTGRTLPSILAFGALCMLGCAPADQSSELEERRAQVAATGAQVMPFDLDATTHVFEKTEFGGIQQVVADAADPRQVALIREHLEVEAERFARGDFHDPAMIHGEHMAGLHQLVQGHERLSIEYSEIDDGGQILYRAEDPGLVAAIHVWFDAQLRDHGDHASGHRP